MKLKLKPVDAAGEVIEIGGEVTPFVESPEVLPKPEGAVVPKAGAAGCPPNNDG